MSAEEVPSVGLSLPGGSEGDVSIQQTKKTPSADVEALIVEPVEKEEEESPEFIRLKAEGNAFVKSEQYSNAIEKYEEALQHAISDNQVAALMHNKGVVYERMEKPEEAVSIYFEATNKKPGYDKVIRRRFKLLSSMKRYEEAMNDIVELTVTEIKNKNENENPEMPESARDLMELLATYAEAEAKGVVCKRETTIPPNYVVDTSLRTFYGDPVSRIWKSLDESPVDKMIQDGSPDLEGLTGYMAALRDLKTHKYNSIRDHCTFEIENPTSEENKLNAYFLRGTMGLIWALVDETVGDFTKVIESPVASDKLKSSAYLKLALRHTGTRLDPTITNLYEEYENSEKLWLENPDVYYHGALTLVERGHPNEAMEMLDMGIRICGENASVLMKTLYWTLKFTLTGDAVERNSAYLELKRLEPSFDSPDCHELYAQALLLCGASEAEEFEIQFNKAIAFNPDDPVFKMKKIIMSQWIITGNAMDEKEGTLQQLYKFVEENGPTSLAYYQIGQMETILGNNEKGIEALNKSIELSSSIHEIEARVAAKLEMLFHMKVQKRLAEEGLDSLTNDMNSLELKPLS